MNDYIKTSITNIKLQRKIKNSIILIQSLIILECQHGSAISPPPIHILSGTSAVLVRPPNNCN